MTHSKAKQLAARLNHKFDKTGDLSEFEYAQLTKAESVIYGYEDFDAGQEIEQARKAFA